MRPWQQSESIVTREIARSKTSEQDSGGTFVGGQLGLRPRTRTKEVSL